MFGKEKIPQLEANIQEWVKQLKKARTRAASFFKYGLIHANKIDAYFALLITAQFQQIRQNVSKLPADFVAGWQEDERWDNWQPETHEFSLIRVGDFIETRATKQRLVPAFAPFISRRQGATRVKKSTIIIKSAGSKADQGASLLQSLMMRTALMLPHQAKYTLVDPAGAGRAFPMRRYLPQVRENTGDPRRDLEGVMVDIQRVIETYLDANIVSFEEIDEAMRVNEAYQFVFAANFPNNYDRRAIEALRHIANTGGDAGVYLFLHYNTSYALPRDISIDVFENAHFIDMSQSYRTNSVVWQADLAPSPEVQTKLFGILRDSKPPERIIHWSDLKSVTTDSANWWQKDATELITAPIGLHGSNNSLNLWFGVQDGRPCAHGMLGAMTGAGKSNLYHVMIASLTTQYSPDELRLYLIDGKDGVEFQSYRHLPHAEVVSLRSSPELSRSVLQELIDEKERRNNLFGVAQVRDFVEYRSKGQPGGKLARIILLVDEYQELFDNDRESVASDLMLQLAAQGRSAGIHMFLGSQHFGAAGMVNRQKIFGNFHLRVAMQMASDDIQALTEFGRKGKALIASTCNLPGKVLVNDRSGDDSENYAGKVAYLPSDDRIQLLELLNKRSETYIGDLPARVIFDGKKQPILMDNPQFAHLLNQRRWFTPQELETLARKPLWDDGFAVSSWFAGERPRAAWLGQDFSVRGQTMVVMRRRIHENVMIVGNANSERFGMLTSFITSLVLNQPPSKSHFFIIDCGIPGTPWGNTIQDVSDTLLKPKGYHVEFTRNESVAETMLMSIVTEIDRRKALNREQQWLEPDIYVIGAELERITTLRRTMASYGMSTSPLGEQFARLYIEGPPLGIHCILSFEGVAPMASVVDERSGLHHFRHRIATQMSEDASFTIIRTRLASRLQVEGVNPICALYFDVENDQSTRFKPYTTKQQLGEESHITQLEQINQQLKQRTY